VVVRPLVLGPSGYIYILLGGVIMAARGARMVAVEMRNVSEDGTLADFDLTWRWDDEPTLVHVQTVVTGAVTDLLTLISSPTADDFDWL
jgi:hypothetical protein